jgi:hypothetical protein
MMARWSPGEDVNAVVHALNRIRCQENGKVTFRGNFRLFEELAETLGSAVEIPLDVPNQQLAAAVRAAICEATASGRFSKEQMIAKIRDVIEDYLARPPVAFWIRTSWSRNIFEPALRSLKFDNGRIMFSQIPRKFDQNAITDIAKANYGVYVPSHYFPLLVHVTARCEYSAINMALDLSDLARALVNFTLNRRSFRRTFSGARQPVNSILPGPLHTVHRVDGSLVRPNAFWYNSRHSFVQENVQSRTRDYSRMRQSTLRLKEKINRSFWGLMRQGLLAYTRALDHIDWQTSFFELWTTLEVITLTESARRSEKLIDRASFLFDNRALARQTLKHLRAKRNSYAHQATEHHDPELLLMQLKGFVEALMLRLIGNPHRLNDSREFANFLDSPDDINQIDKQIRVLRCAKKTLVSKPTP